MSIDAAIKIAEFYHLAGLKETMQHIKTDKEEREERLVTARNKRRRWLKPEPAPREIQTTNRQPRKDPLAERYPPPTIDRPGMARVTVPVIESSQYVKSDAAGMAFQRSVREPSLTPDPAIIQDSKRKRDVGEESQEDDFTMPPPKLSTLISNSRYTNPIIHSQKQTHLLSGLVRKRRRIPLRGKRMATKPSQRAKAFSRKLMLHIKIPTKQNGPFPSRRIKKKAVKRHYLAW